MNQLELQDRREILIHAMRNAVGGLTPWQNMILLPVLGEIMENKHGDYLSVSEKDPARVAYSPVAGNLDRRTVTTLGRVLVRSYGRIDERIGQLALVDFVNRVVALVDQEYRKRGITNTTFKVIEGDAIADAYYHRIGGSSCMTGNREIVDLYVCNPEIVKMVTMTDHATDFTARALLWTPQEGKPFMDRIYPASHGPHTQMLTTWAEAHGFEIRNQQGYYPYVGVNDRWVILQLPESGRYPYIDSLRVGVFIGDGSDIIRECGTGTALMLAGSRDTLERKRHDPGFPEYLASILPLEASSIVFSRAFDFNRQDGNDPRCIFGTCTDCGVEIECEDDACYYGGDLYCESCFQDEFVYCSGCGDAERVSDLELVYIRQRDRDTGEWIQDRWCELCVEHSAYRCESCDDLWEATGSSDSTTVNVSGSDESWCPHCVEARAVSCNRCDNYFTSDECNSTPEGENLCNGCYEQWKNENKEDEEDEEE